MIQFNEVSLKLGQTDLFRDLSFVLHAQEKVGLIGQNGAGKSTLFNLIRQDLEADSGEIHIPKNMSLSWVKQETPALACSALDYVLDGDAIYRQQEQELIQIEQTEDMDALGRVHEWMIQTDFYSKPSKAAKLLTGLGFSDAEQQKSVAEFSGGWRMRLNLAQALISDSDILLLDEPTNHLDLEAVLWLESWLKTYPGIYIVISHDREFLDQTVKVILHLEDKVIRRYSGNYSRFETILAMQRAEQQSAFEKQQRERAHIQSFVDRFKAQATKARQAQSRIKALEKMAEISPFHDRAAFQFQFQSLDVPGHANLLQLIDANLGYGDQVILHEVQLAIAAGERIGLLGPNGAGKSTLIKALAGDDLPISGVRQASPHLKLGYFSQHQMDILHDDQSPAWHLRELAPAIAEPTLRKFLGQFHFQGDRVFEKITYFSGGEKARLALALMVWQRPNLLLMDEPTNHLDMEMREALIIALQDYEGAVVLISHDRHLLRTCVDDLYLVYEGALKPFPGNIDDYPAWWKSEQDQKAQRLKPIKAPKASASTGTADSPKNDAKVCQKLESELSLKHGHLAHLEARLADAKMYEPNQKEALRLLLNEQASYKAEVQVLEEQLLTAMLALEKQLNS
jgi:ATP-binding cassette subfamily F protein 3